MKTHRSTKCTSLQNAPLYKTHISKNRTTYFLKPHLCKKNGTTYFCKMHLYFFTAGNHLAGITSHSLSAASIALWFWQIMRFITTCGQCFKGSGFTQITS